MKRLVVLAACAVAACGAQEPSGIDGGGEPLLEMAGPDVLMQLQSGDGAACAHPAVMATFHSLVVDNTYSMGTWEDHHKQAYLDGLQYGIDRITLEGRDTSISKVACRGVYYATWQGEGGRGETWYDVMPTVDGSDFVVEAHDLSSAIRAFASGTVAYYSENMRAEREAAQAERDTAQLWATLGARCREAEQYTGSDYREESAANLAALPEPQNAEQRATRDCLAKLSQREPVSAWSDAPNDTSTAQEY